jgi:hypothetical protein
MKLSRDTSPNPLRVIIKTLVLLILINLLAIAFYPQALGQFSAYNVIFPGRERFPFGEDPQHAYNLSLFDVDAMYKSLALDGATKPDSEYRVFVIGDSSVWGTLLKPEETLPGLLDSANLSACGKTVRVFNLGYPTISLAKDLMLLNEAMRYQPDLIIWMTTLEAFPKDKQLASPLVANNPERVRELVSRFGLGLNPAGPPMVESTFLDKTIVGQRRPFMDLIRLQLYGVMWAATGVDQVYPANYEPASVALKSDETFHGMTPPDLDPGTLSLDVLDAGFAVAGDVPVLLVNEPMLVSSGQNSDVRYNFFYPRWAYDQYRQLLADHAAANGWRYLDLWNIVPAEKFTNSAIHLNPDGEKILAERIGLNIVDSCR